jgi:hypothetical protein
MNHANETARLTRTKKASFVLITLLILVALFVASAEAFVRWNGFEPWRKSETTIQVEPGGKFFKTHPALGYSHYPGKFTVTLASGYVFNVTHLPNTLRVTHPIKSDGDDNLEDESQKEEIWIFGCSFTHGWSLDDHETYPWVLQERLPEYEVVNFGVSGYGTIHSLLQFQDALKTRTPKVAVLAYAGFHDSRNTFLRSRRKEIAPWNKLGPLVQPYARLNEAGGLDYLFADVEYPEFPMMRHSAFVHFLEMHYNQLETKWRKNRAVSRALVLEMANLAKRRDVEFVVAAISEGSEMLEFATQNRILNVDISVDARLPENSNLPHDTHPSAIANQKFADKLEGFFNLAFKVR